ncbi:MAG: TonB-dependent receptor [Cyclobacteriaceae bacterium]|nr:TonB-dependent receptor [Cyclobacteriaceae bacterium]
MLLISAQVSLGQDLPDQPIDVSFTKVKLKKALKIIEAAGNVRFSYSKKIIPVDEEVSCQRLQSSIEAILDEILKPLGIEYQLVDSYIVLRPAGNQNKEPTAAAKPKTTSTISGYITEAATGEVLIGATVMVPQLQQGTITNAYGFYSLSLPSGNHQLVTRYIGYKEISQAISLYRDIRSDHQLHEELGLLPELTIREDQSMAFVENIKMGYAPMKPEEVAQMPALMGEKDVIRSMQAVPGIKMYADGSTMYHVRGGNRDQNLILLDDAPLYNPSHLLGLYSTIIPEATKDIKIYKGDMPVQFGGRLSSLIDIKTNEGNLKQFGLSGSFGLSALRAAIEAPLKKDKSSFFVGTRISNLYWFTKNVANTDADIGFYDLNTKFNIALNDKNRLLFSFYSGQDQLDDAANSGIKWGNFAATLRWNHIYNHRLFSNTTLATSNYNYYVFTNLDQREGWHSSISNTSIKSDYSFYINPQSNMYFGLSLAHHQFNPGNYEYGDGKQAEGFALVPKKYANELIMYVGHEQQFLDKWFIRYGLRLTTWQNVGPTTEYLYDDQYQVSQTNEIPKGKDYHSYTNVAPRLALTYRFSDTFSGKVSYSRNVQNIHLISNSISPFTNFEVWLPSSINIKPQKADQLTGGVFAKWPAEGFSFTAEAYYKWMSGQIDYVDHAALMLNPHIEGELRFGQGRAYGGELELKKEMGRLTARLGYAYSRSFCKWIS